MNINSELELIVYMLLSAGLATFVITHIIRSGFKNTNSEIMLLNKIVASNSETSLKNKHQAQYDFKHNLIMDIADTRLNKKGIEQHDDMKLHFESAITYYKNTNEKPIKLSEYKKELQSSPPIERPVFKIVE